LMSDPGWQATMDVLTPLLPAALFSDQRLFSLVVARMANVSLEHGHTDGSCLAYVWLGLLLGPSFNNYPAAFAFGQLGLNLLEKRGLNRFRARVLLDFSHVVNPWMQHARVGPGLVRRAFDGLTRPAISHSLATAVRTWSQRCWPRALLFPRFSERRKSSSLSCSSFVSA
jgi:hypothetical protein